MEDGERYICMHMEENTAACYSNKTISLCMTLCCQVSQSKCLFNFWMKLLI